jgi:hypothetical protein
LATTLIIKDKNNGMSAASVFNSTNKNMKNNEFTINNNHHFFSKETEAPKVFQLTRGDTFRRLSARTHFEKEIEVFKVVTERCRISVTHVADKNHPTQGYVNLDIETGQMRKAFADGSY